VTRAEQFGEALTELLGSFSDAPSAELAFHCFVAVGALATKAKGSIVTSRELERLGQEWIGRLVRAGLVTPTRVGAEG